MNACKKIKPNMYIVVYTHSNIWIMNANANMNAASSHHFVWRPPYPSENLKTPRPQTQRPPTHKTYSTTNPYAMQEDEQEQNHHTIQMNQDSHLNQFQDFQHSKRENNSNKIYERGLTPQVGMNPFLKDRNYLQDLETQNEFLKPINSNI